MSVAFGEDGDFAWGFVAFGGVAGLASFEGACLFLGDRGSTSTALPVGLEATFERVARLSATMAREEFTPKSRNGGVKAERASEMDAQRRVASVNVVSGGRCPPRGVRRGRGRRPASGDRVQSTRVP